MPPKRRKLSVDDGGLEENNRFATENEADAESAIKSSDGNTDKSSDTVEKDSRKSKTSTNADFSAEAKAKDDALKPTRISERLIIKRNRLGDAEETENQIQVPFQNQTTPRKPKAARQTGKQHTAGKKNKRRPWAHWSVRDEKLFFIGIGEFGKNFEAISNKISHAAKQNGLPIKDKMQVRYFYYRCWAKISKFIHLNYKGVKMKSPELYGLINYGVLKQHVTENDPQFGRCLNELIHRGQTTYTYTAVRGRKRRVGKIRTPVCTYLKKINRIEDKQASELSASQNIPQQITLELTPKNSEAWARIQGMSQNPRLRFKLTANRTLEAVFKYLEKKWKSRRVRLKESLGATEESKEELICFLHPSCKITPVKLIPQEQQKVDVTFTSYRENILPTLQKSKKAKVKETDKPSEDKDKLKDEIKEEQGAVGKVNSDSAEVCCSSKPKEDVDLIPVEQQNFKCSTEYPSAFGNLLTTAASSGATFCHSDVARVGQTAGQFVPSDIPVGPKPPTALLEDENAMFPDSSSFSPPSCSFSETPNPSVIIPSSPSPESSSLPPHLPPSVISSPTVGKKKSTKASKKTAISEEGIVPLDKCDNNIAAIVSDNSSSPAKTDVSASAEDLKENLEKEIARITTLATEGFTIQTSNTVTLLHLSLILGRESVIKLEYEWKEKRPPKVQPLPLLCQAANQMSNVLRRLCNLATVELTDFVTYEKTIDQNKPLNKSVPCSHCGREGSTKSRGKRHIQTERKESTKEMATMTDPLKLEPPSLEQMFQPASVQAATGRTFVAAPTSQASLQIPGSDPLFRVPFTPTVKSVSSKEEQLRLEQQRLQLQAKAIMQQAPSPHNRLLKKRTFNPRNRKTPSIIVQRTLLPKVVTGQMVTYIQQQNKQLVTRPMVAPDNLVKITHPVVNIATCSAKTLSQDHILSSNTGPTNDALSLAAQSAEINSSSPIKSENSGENSGLTVSSSLQGLFPLSVVVTSASSSLKEIHTEVAGSVLNTQGDISISDLDISMSSVTSSNLGPDAGDKFLDMVLQNSEQGFSGMISTPKKFTRGITCAAASFDPSILRTPPHVGISTYLHPSSIYPSPIKLSFSDQSWISTDIKEERQISEKPPSPPPTSYAVFFETSSSDVSETGSIVFSKPSTVIDISLSSLLGDTCLKKEDPDFGDTCLKKEDEVSPPVSASSEVASKTGFHAGGGLFSEATSSIEATQLFSEISQDSFARFEVDRSFQGLVNESSIDLVSKFQLLAAHVTGHQEGQEM